MMPAGASAGLSPRGKRRARLRASFLLVSHRCTSHAPTVCRWWVTLAGLSSTTTNGLTATANALAYSMWITRRRDAHPRGPRAGGTRPRGFRQRALMLDARSVGAAAAPNCGQSPDRYLIFWRSQLHRASRWTPRRHVSMRCPARPCLYATTNEVSRRLHAKLHARLYRIQLHSSHTKITNVKSYGCGRPGPSSAAPLPRSAQLKRLCGARAMCRALLCALITTHAPTLTHTIALVMLTLLPSLVSTSV